MNMFDSSFLCLDIGTSCVRGIAHRIRNARIDKSSVYYVENFDTVFAVKSVLDELERQMGTRFDSAYITGDFGDAWFTMTAKNTVWNGEHKITDGDIQSQLSSICPPDGFHPMHIIPLRYDTPTARNMLTPIGHIDRQLISAFGAICYSDARMNEIYNILRRAHITSNGFFDPTFVLNASIRKQNETVMFIDMGAASITCAIWNDRGPVWHNKIMHGGTDITNDVADKLKIDFDSAEQIKRRVASLIPSQMDRFTPADTAYGFSRADVNEIVSAHIVNMIGELKDTVIGAFEKYKPNKIVLTGGGAHADGVCDFIENTFGITAETLPNDAALRGLADYIWDLNAARRAAYIARSERAARRMQRISKLFQRKPKQKKQFIPIMPSTLCFDMSADTTYSLFAAGNISMVHVDIMDGFYVDQIAGSINELRYIREHTNAHLHVHLMTESPAVWAADAVAAGADTVIVSTNTSGVRAALRVIHAAGKRAGIALHPDSSVTILKPILREIDEVMVMAVVPGAAGQSFNPDALHKIAILAATRKKYGLKFKISVDGGINENTAQMCWNMGADFLVSGSYLAHASDFPLAVQSMLHHE